MSVRGDRERETARRELFDAHDDPEVPEVHAIRIADDVVHGARPPRPARPA